MTLEEIKYISKPPNYLSQKDKIWIKAFDDYNNDHKEDRPLPLHCIACYRKVFLHIIKKYAQPKS